MSSKTPTITRVRSDAPIAKRFSVNPDTGDLTKHPADPLSSGEAEVLDTPSAAALAGLIERLDPADVLILGRPRNGARTATIKTDKRVKGMGADVAAARGIIARTTDDFAYPAGPGWLLIDHDTDGMPADVRARIEALGGGQAALAHIWPDVLKAARVFKPSSSGGVYVEGGSPRAATGFHLFVLVEDVSRSAEALAALQARAWGAGLAFFRLSAAGGRLERSIIDTAVGSPERVIYTGPPVLGPGVRRDPPPVQFYEGEAIPVPDAPAPEVWEPIRDAARAALEPEAVRVTATRRGISEPEAREIVRAGGTREDLSGDVLIYGPGGGSTTVRDLVAGLSRPCRLSMPDPFEGPAYGMTTASLFWGRGHPAPIIVSHAHGVRTVYRLPPPERADAPAQTPAQAIWDVRPADLKDRREAALVEALEGVPDLSQIGTVLAVAAALANRTPAQMSLEDVARFLKAGLRPGAVPAEWISAVMARLRWTQDKRRDRALAPVTISAKAREGVEVVRVASLGELDRIEGITVVKAPMASGKTQLVARPWIEAAKRAMEDERAAAENERETARAERERIRAEEQASGARKRRRPENGEAQGGADLDEHRAHADAAKAALEQNRRSVWAICHRVTLVEELAQRLDLESYRDKTATGTATAICLPSITLDPFARRRPAFLFIDEIQQVLRFLRSQECCRTAKARTPDKVFERLVEVVKGARGILVADAGADDTVLDFLRFCRPGETIRLVEMAEPEDAGIEATVLSGEKGVYGAAVDQVAGDLHKGEKVWIATEGAEAAEKVAAFLRDATAAADHPVRVLSLTARNKAGADQEAFLKDPERESRRWDCVIASPVIASGISVEHKGAPHFTRGVYLGTGLALTPADAAQQLRRVRYLKRFTIALAQNNSTGGRSVEAILKGRADAARDEGFARAPGAFDHLVARFEAQEADAKADFAAGLWWQLEAAGWTLKRGTVEDGGAADAMRQIAADRAADRTRRLVEVSKRLSDMDQDLIDRLRQTDPSGNADLIEAWGIARGLGVEVLTPEDVAFADAGGIAQLDRFDDLSGIAPGELSDNERDGALVHRRLRIARAKHFAEIFDGFDPLSPDPWLTREVADKILDRVMLRADAYVASGAIPAKYAARFGRPAPTRPRDPVKAIQAILARAGLRTVLTRTRRGDQLCRIPPDCVTESTPIRHTSPSQRSAQSKVERVHAARPEDVEAMQRRSAIRFAARLRVSSGAQIERINRLFTKLDSAGVPYEVSVHKVAVEDIGDPWGREVARHVDFLRGRELSRVARAAVLMTAPGARASPARSILPWGFRP
jgi:hypothetical protein